MQLSTARLELHLLGIQRSAALVHLLVRGGERGLRSGELGLGRHGLGSELCKLTLRLRRQRLRLLVGRGLNRRLLRRRVLRHRRLRLGHLLRRRRRRLRLRRRCLRRRRCRRLPLRLCLGRCLRRRLLRRRHLRLCLSRRLRGRLCHLVDLSVELLDLSLEALLLSLHLPCLPLPFCPVHVGTRQAQICLGLVHPLIPRSLILICLRRLRVMVRLDGMVELRLRLPLLDHRVLQRASAGLVRSGQHAARAAGGRTAGRSCGTAALRALQCACQLLLQALDVRSQPFDLGLQVVLS